VPVPLVFDHLGRIAPEQAGKHPAHALLLQLMGEGRAWVKLSGGYIVSATHAVDDPALDALAASYLRAAPERVLWGSDWPVLNLAADYASWLAVSRSLLAHLDPAEQAAIFGENARRVYRLVLPPDATNPH